MLMCSPCTILILNKQIKTAAVAKVVEGISVYGVCVIKR